ncbi:MAG: maleylacetoacetate isomerase, partial [Pseudomonadota bacterium]
MSIKLYGYWRSTASYRVRIALNLKQVDYEYCPIHLVEDGGQQNKEQYLRLNPSKLVPTFVDDDEDITLHQSLAIIEYLDEKYDQGERLIPDHKLDRARVRMLSEDIACDIQPIVNLRVLQKLKGDYHADDKQINAW